MHKSKALVLRKAQPLENYLEEPIYRLDWILVDTTISGKKIDGCIYYATNIDTGDQITVEIKEKKLHIADDVLKILSTRGRHMYVEFENATVLPYYSYGERCIRDNVRATGIHVVCIQ